MKNELAKYTTEELQNEINNRNKVDRDTELRNFSINGITTKDFAVVHYADDDGWGDSYGFLLKHGKKSYCIYYDYNSEKPQKWWPTHTEFGYVENATESFIPQRFVEQCENLYSFDGSYAEAVEYLKTFGIIDVSEGNI